MDLALLIIFLNLLLLFTFVMIKQINNRFFKSLLLLPVSRWYLKVYEQKISNRNIIYAIFFMLAITSLIIAALYFDLHVVKDKFYTFHQMVNLPSEDIYIWLSVSFILLIIKPFVEYFFCYIVDIHQFVEKYILYKFNLTNYCLILLAPLMLINEFNDFNIIVNKTIIISLLGFIYLAGILGFMLKYTRFILSNLHYFILYLCTFETGMYFIIYHLVFD